MRTPSPTSQSNAPKHNPPPAGLPPNWNPHLHRPCMLDPPPSPRGKTAPDTRPSLQGLETRVSLPSLCVLKGVMEGKEGRGKLSDFCVQTSEPSLEKEDKQEMASYSEI